MCLVFVGSICEDPAREKTPPFSEASTPARPVPLPSCLAAAACSSVFLKVTHPNNPLFILGIDECVWAQAHAFFIFIFSLFYLLAAFYTVIHLPQQRRGNLSPVVNQPCWGKYSVFFYIADEDGATGNELMCIIYNFEHFSLAVWFLFRRREGKKKPVAAWLSPDLGLEGVQILVIKLEKFLWISGGLSCWFSLVFPSCGRIANCYWQHGTCELVRTPQSIAQYHLSRKQYAH